MDVHVVDHPLAKARLSTMRDARTDSAAFRAALHELTVMLVYEATRSVPVKIEKIHTPVARTDGYKLAKPPLLVPVLRAGLGMAEAALGLLPDADVLRWRAEDVRVVVRPSGTEPKLKAYLEVVGDPAALDDLRAELTPRLS